MVILRKKRYITEINYSLNFPYHGSFANGGFSFPCDKDGNLLASKMPNPIGMLESYLTVLKNPKDFGVGAIEKKEVTTIQSAVGKCDCGEEVELSPQYMGACECPRCGQWYNVFGQKLKNPEFWEEF